MKRRKTYRQVRDPVTGKRLLAHRVQAQRVLGRPLLPREIVHHRDGDSTNNAPENLIVLPSQRYHAHAEFHLRRERTGMPSLFPELFEGLKRQPSGGLFDCVLTVQVQEPPLPVRRMARSPAPVPDGEPLFPVEVVRPQPSLILPDVVSTSASGARRLGELLAQFQVQVREGRGPTRIPLTEFSSEE